MSPSIISGLLDYSQSRPLYFQNHGGAIRSSKVRYILGIIASGLATRGSRFGQPSILATTGRLGPNTESASLSISSSVPTAPPSGFVISRPSYGGSRFGKPSILASTGQLGPDTSSVPIFISSPSSGFKVSRHSSVGSRFGQPSILASTGQLSQDTDSASLSISSTRPSRSPGSSKLSIVSVSPWTTVSSSPSSQTINNYSGSRYHIIMFCQRLISSSVTSGMENHPY